MGFCFVSDSTPARYLPVVMYLRDESLRFIGEVVITKDILGKKSEMRTDLNLKIRHSLSLCIQSLYFELQDKRAARVT